MHPGIIIGSALAAILGVAVVAVLVSSNAQTPGVLTAGGTALAGVIQAAVSPVTGSVSSGNLLGSSTGNYSTNALGSLLTNGF